LSLNLNLEELFGPVPRGSFFVAMISKERKSRFKIRKTYSVEPMPLADRQAAERILARLVAKAYAADHPELFGSSQGEGESDSGDLRDSDGGLGGNVEGQSG
jgi:hypothetical protein